MKTAVRLLIFIFFLFPVINTYAGDHTKEFRTWVEKINKKWQEAMLNNDFAFLRTLYAEDAIQLPSYEPMVRGVSNIMDNHKKMVDAGFKVNTADFETVEVMGSGDLIYEIGTWKMNMNVPGMPQSVDDNGKYLTVWKKSGDTYKIVAETWNSDNSPWQDMMSGEKEKESKY